MTYNVYMQKKQQQKTNQNKQKQKYYINLFAGIICPNT